MSGVGFRIVREVPRPPDDVVAALRGKATSDLADAMRGLNVMEPSLQRRSGSALCGVAVTVSAAPGDNLMVRKAFDLASPGDVVVVSTNGNETNAVVGDLMAKTALELGVGGIVIDGAVRDVAGIREIGLPVFSRFVTPRAPSKVGPGEINVPIACGGVAVLPGDVVVGDEDGVVVVPRADAEAVLRAVEEVERRERERRAAMEAGEIYGGDVDDILRRGGVIE